MYKLLQNNWVLNLETNSMIPPDFDNSDYKKYLAWIEEGNTPIPADTIPELTYAELRRNEYPPIEDYIDGIVKGDREQIDTYIQKCLEVKAKYPKPI